jgi:hypothetical protein
MPANVHPRIRAMAEKVIAEGANKRAIAVLRVLLKRGAISTDDLNEMGYNHPPRAVGDVRDAGIPIITDSGISAKTGRRMAVYKFGNPEDIQSGRIGGRSAFPKGFEDALIQRYGTIDCITGATLDPKVLSIDHRVPYRIAGDVGLEDHDVAQYMLLDGSSQRAKSWACEHCPNMMGARRAAVCQSCFWAYPENYQHIATEPYRRVDVTWQNADVLVHDRLKEEADKLGVPVAELIRRIARQRGKDS